MDRDRVAEWDRAYRRILGLLDSVVIVASCFSSDWERSTFVSRSRRLGPRELDRIQGFRGAFLDRRIGSQVR